jgi:hypothetical protein
LHQWKGGLLSLAVLSILLIWNWQLILAAIVGLAGLVVTYLAQQRQLRLPAAHHWQRLWTRANRPLTLSVGLGSIAALSTYLTIAIWQESQGSWLGTGVILQGFGLLAVLGLLSRSFWQQPVDPPTNDLSFHQLLNQLADDDPLKRLIAVRQLTEQMLAASAHASATLPLTPSHLAECFRLQLDRETEPVVRRALLEGLQLLGQSRMLQRSGRSTVDITVATKSKRQIDNV